MNTYIPNPYDLTPSVTPTNTDSTPESLLSQLPQATGAERSQLLAQLLKYYFDAGLEAYYATDKPRANQLWQQGIQYSEQFLQEHESDPRLQEQVLTLYSNLGASHGQAGELTAAIQQSQRGLALAEAWSLATTTDPRLQDGVLILYFNLGVSHRQAKELTAEIQQYQRGLALAEAWSLATTTDPRVQKQVLRLYVNLGFSLGQAGELTAAIQQYQRGLALAEAWSLATTTDPRVQEQVLKLYSNLGLSHGHAGELTEAIQQYQRGLALVQQWLAIGEAQDAEVRNMVFQLNGLYTNTYYNTHQIPSLLTALPALGFWSWISPKSVASDETIKRNWQIYLGIIPTYAQVTTAFQTFFSTLVQTWHQPQRPHRHFDFLPTDGLLTLSESLYAFAQAQENQGIQIAYRRLEELTQSPWVKQAQTDLTTLRELSNLNSNLNSPRTDLTTLRELSNLNSTLNFPPSDLTTLRELSNLNSNLNSPPTDLTTFKKWSNLIITWWQRRRRDSTRKQLTQSLLHLTQQANADPEWQQLTRNSEHALTNWLQTSIQGRLELTTQGLADLPAIVLGLLLASQAIDKKTTPEQIVATWQPDPAATPWHTTAQLKEALALTHWQKWVSVTDPEKPQKPLYAWTGQYTYSSPRLKVDTKENNKPQPKLHKWLEELGQSLPSASPLAAAMKEVWSLAQTKARPLASIFTALADLQFASNLFTKSDFTDIAYTQALTTVLLGDVERQIEARVQTWLGWSTTNHPTPTLPVYAEGVIPPVYGGLGGLEELGGYPTPVDTANSQQTAFARIVKVNRQPKIPALGTTVHDWAQVRLAEVLTTPARGQQEQIFALLERARLGLLGVTFTLPKELTENMGEALWKSLERSIQRIIAGHLPTAPEIWPPLTTWLHEMTTAKLIPQPPSVQTCLQRLDPNEALVQPFFDPVQQRLRVLWLDKVHGLELRDLPDACAMKPVWTNQETQQGIIDQWTRGMSKWKEVAQRGNENDTKITVMKWEAILATEPAVQTLADTLHQWADGLTQLTIIWPAPLGQLPWDTLPALETLLVREVSLTHWLGTARDTPLLTKGVVEEGVVTPWVLSDPSGQKFCMVKEAQWVAQQLHTTPDSPCPTLFEALQRLLNCQQAHLATHGEFNRRNPIESRLSLDDKKGLYFPLWLTTISPLTADLIVLSACESNLSGTDTAGLLTPIGIGPSLAAAGAKTVIGTLWPCNGLAATYFSYYLYQLAAESPNQPWHHLVAAARQKVRGMDTEEVMALAEQMNLYDPKDTCRFEVHRYQKAAMTGEYPFARPYYWAGFMVLGQVER